MDSIIKLFESAAKVKLMKLFLMRPELSFSFDEITKKTRIQKTLCRKELQKLIVATLITKKDVKKTIIKGKKKTNKVVTMYTLNPKCSFKDGLYTLLADGEAINIEALDTRFKNAGKLDLLVASGFFTNVPDARVDLLLVGKKLKKSIIEKAISVIESEIGRELTYALFETEDFLYRAHMYDKLVRDVIDFPHVKVVDRGVLSQVPKMSSF